MANPTRIDSRTLFPRACVECGAPNSADAFRVAHNRHVRTCKACEAQAMREYRERFPERARAADRAFKERHPDRVRAWRKRYRQEHYEQEQERQRAWRAQNEKTAKTAQRRWMDDVHPAARAGAHHHGHEWTGAELEVADRRDLSAPEVAAKLGRTVHAVYHVRRRIDARDPRTLSKLGYDPNKEN